MQSNLQKAIVVLRAIDLVLNQGVKSINTKSNIVAQLHDIFAEVNHFLETLSWPVSDLRNHVASSAFHELLVLVKLNLIQHLKDFVVDCLILQATVLESL